MSSGIGPPLMPAELAKMMGCSRPVIDAALKDGTIPHVRLGRRRFIPRAIAESMLIDGKIPKSKEQKHRPDAPIEHVGSVKHG